MGYKYLPDSKSETHVFVAYAKLGFKQESTCWEKWMKEESFSWENWKKSLQMPKVLTVGKTGSSAVAAGAARSSAVATVVAGWPTWRQGYVFKVTKVFLGWTSWIVKKVLESQALDVNFFLLFPLTNHRLVDYKSVNLR